MAGHLGESPVCAHRVLLPSLSSSYGWRSEQRLLLLTYPCPAHSLCNFLAEMVSKDCLCLLGSSSSSSSPSQAIPSKMT